MCLNSGSCLQASRVWRADVPAYHAARCALKLIITAPIKGGQTEEDPLSLLIGYLTSGLKHHSDRHSLCNNNYLFQRDARYVCPMGSNILGVV